uniref:Uncharacterized protein n=1 Tax=uncultured Caudovirales phage TaxID=2100421 RepID=A0A6J5LAF8_9CAUD|nr:hypothetical protein UFOVP114_83 [uncultured Caudovirales phage]
MNSKAKANITKQVKALRDKLADQLATRRRRARTCGECTGCNQEPLCGWRQGLLSDEERPDKIGAYIRGAGVPTADGGLQAAVIAHAMPDVLDTWHDSMTHRFVERLCESGLVLLYANTDFPVWVGGPMDEVTRVIGLDNMPESVKQKTGIVAFRLQKHADAPPDAPEAPPEPADAAPACDVAAPDGAAPEAADAPVEGDPA